MKRGFTIVELLIAIVVIAILAAISVVAYNGIQNRANDTAVESDLGSIAKKIHAFNAVNGRFPKGYTDLMNSELKVTRPAYSQGMLSGGAYYNIVYCWPNSANPNQFALIAQSKSGNVFEYSSGRVRQASYSYTGGSVVLCTNAGNTMDTGSERDWFYNGDTWMSYAAQ